MVDYNILTGRYVMKVTPRSKSRKTIAKILAAAEDLFLAKSYAEVTMDQIAERSAVTKGALYHHFPGKEALYLAMMQADFAAKKTLFAQALAQGSGCRERLCLLTRAYFDLPRAKSDIIKLVRRDVNIFERPIREKIVRAYQTALPELVERVMQDGIASGELAQSDPRLLAWHFVAIVEVTLAPYADKAFQTPEKKLNYVIDLFFRGAAAGKQRKEAAAA